MKDLNNYEDYDYFLKCVGTFFKKQRLNKEEKIYSVSSSLGITHPVISKIENGKYYSLSFKLTICLLQHYNASIDDLLIYLVSRIVDEDNYLINSPNGIITAQKELKFIAGILNKINLDFTPSK